MTDFEQRMSDLITSKAQELDDLDLKIRAGEASESDKETFQVLFKEVKYLEQVACYCAGMEVAPTINFPPYPW